MPRLDSAAQCRRPQDITSKLVHPGPKDGVPFPSPTHGLVLEPGSQAPQRATAASINRSPVLDTSIRSSLRHALVPSHFINPNKCTSTSPPLRETIPHLLQLQRTPDGQRHCTRVVNYPQLLRDSPPLPASMACPSLAILMGRETVCQIPGKMYFDAAFCLALLPPELCVSRVNPSHNRMLCAEMVFGPQTRGCLISLECVVLAQRQIVPCRGRRS